MQIVLFEDDAVDRLAPLAAAEPAFAVTCGGYKLVQLVRGLGPVYTVVRKHLASVEAQTYPDRVLPQQPLTGPVLFVNSRLVPSASVLGRLKSMVDAGQEGVVVAADDSIAAAIDLGATAGWSSSAKDAVTVVSWLRSKNLPKLTVDLPLIEFPHDVLRHHLHAAARTWNIG